jgi:putative restriction endonuclease
MVAYVGVTDYEWYRFLRDQHGIDEVNFWKPGGKQGFAALPVGGLFLFKLHSPRNVIVGGGFFGYFSQAPTSLAWDAFGEKNGARSLSEMRARIEQYRRTPPGDEDYTIGCILLQEPFFFQEHEWIAAPGDWQPNIVQGRRYDLTVAPGAELWAAVQQRLERRRLGQAVVAERPRYGNPVAILPRLGQGTFRVAVTDAYSRRCAMTGERTLPVLEAAHIKPYSGAGENRVTNGLLLRSDLHRLFDRGYVTVSPALRIHVSSRIREEFENGRDYYALEGQKLRAPVRSEDLPDPAALEWHADAVFRR